MSAPASIPIFGDAYLADTQHLTLEEHGAYFKLMIIAWRSPGCALPNDDRRIATMLGIGGKKWAGLKPAVMAFWTLSDAGFQQKRLLKEYRWAAEKARLNSEAAEARWKDKPRKTNKPSDADAYPNGYAPPPPPHKEKKDDDVSAGASACADILDVPMPDVLNVAAEAARAAGVRHNSPGDIIKNSTLIREWQEAGADPPSILAAIRDDRARPDAPPITSLKFFDAAIRKGIAQREATEHGHQSAPRPMAGSTGAKPVYRSNPALDRYRALIGEFDGATEADAGPSRLHHGTGLALPQG